MTCVRKSILIGYSRMLLAQIEEESFAPYQDVAQILRNELTPREEKSYLAISEAEEH